MYRDLKLENVLLTTDGHLRLVDMGIAKTIKVNAQDKTNKRQRNITHKTSQENATQHKMTMTQDNHKTRQDPKTRHGTIRQDKIRQD